MKLMENTFGTVAYTVSPIFTPLIVEWLWYARSRLTKNNCQWFCLGLSFCFLFCHCFLFRFVVLFVLVWRLSVETCHGASLKREHKCPIVQLHFRWQRYNKTSRLSRVLRNFFLAGNQLFTNFTLTVSVAIVNFGIVVSREIGRRSDEATMIGALASPGFRLAT